MQAISKHESKFPLLAQTLLAALLLFAACAPHAEEAKSTERWPWYGEWEQARFATFSPLVQSLLKRDETEALRLIENGANLVDFVSEHEIRRMAEPRVKISYIGGEPEADYPLVILAAVADLPRVVAAMGARLPGALSAPDPKGNTALAWAARAGHADVVKVLLAHGLAPLHRDDDNYTPLSLAVYKKHTEAVRLLIAAIPRERYRDVGIIDQVWMASYLEDTDTLRVLLEAGVPPDYIALQGGSALISAVEDGNLERVKLLLKHGATVDEHRYRGRNIFEIAEAKRLSRQTDDAQEIYRLIQAAPRIESHWEKPADIVQMEKFFRMLEHPEEFSAKAKP